MRKLFVAALLGLSVAAGVVPAVAAPPATRAAAGWRLAGQYRSYDAASRKADQLEARGYDTRIRRQNGSWRVYYR